MNSSPRVLPLQGSDGHLDGLLHCGQLTVRYGKLQGRRRIIFYLPFMILYINPSVDVVNVPFQRNMKAIAINSVHRAQIRSLTLSQHYPTSIAFLSVKIDMKYEKLLRTLHK